MSGLLEIVTSSTLWKWVMKHEQTQSFIYFWKSFFCHCPHQQHQGFGSWILTIADLPSHRVPQSFYFTDTEDASS